MLGIPNARVHADQMRWQLLGQGEGTVGAIKGLVSVAAIEPEDLWSLGERLGYAVRVTWSRDHGVAAMSMLCSSGLRAARRPCGGHPACVHGPNRGGPGQ